MADFYALLIGIDRYQPNPYYQSLQGAVRDIDKVASYLETSLKIPMGQITKLTSRLSDVNSLKDARSVAPDLPTYHNIITTFGQITATAQPQDLVYIHYSGHGGRAKTIFADLKGEGQLDESLVPMDVGNESYYLRDVEMATLLKRMTDKGLIVTVVFDSCHAGGATRGDGKIRGARNSAVDTQNRPIDSAVATRDELVRNWQSLTQDVKKEGWLPNQSDYVFLGACRPSEYAYEAVFGTGNERNGALTYWMLDTLNAVPQGLTYQALYDRVTGQIQSRFPNQLPMLLGEADRLVFGSEIKAVQYSLTLLNVAAGQVTLNGGLLQGLGKGTRFSLYPVGIDLRDRQNRIAVVEIIDLQASTATAKVLSLEECGIAAVTVQIAPGLPAAIESTPVDLQHRIRLYEKAVGDRENELPADLAQKQADALNKVRQAMQGNGWVTEVLDKQAAAHYQVAVGLKNEYEIGRLMPISNLTPALNIDAPNSPAEVVKRLVHLAKYQTAQSLSNPASELTKAIEYELLDAETKQPLPDPNNICLKSGDRVYVRLKNVSSQPLNLAVLDFEATWEISQIPIQGDRAAFYSLAPGEETLTCLRLQVPNGEYYQQSKEILKLFVTRGVANFQWLLLPSLDNANELEYQKIRDRISRSVEIPNPLSQLLSTIGADIDEPPILTRVSSDHDSTAEWLTREILINVELKDD